MLGSEKLLNMALSSRNHRGKAAKSKHIKLKLPGQLDTLYKVFKNWENIFKGS